MANLSDILTNYQSVDTLDSVTDRGATTTNAITIGNLTSTGIDDNASSTAMTIDSSGNVGIGTTTPGNQLHIASSGSNYATMRLDAPGNTTPATFQIRAHDGVLDIRDTQNAATRVYINSSGNVGIGTTNPTSKLQVEGTVAVSPGGTAGDFLTIASGNYQTTIGGWSNGTDSDIDGLLSGSTFGSIMRVAPNGHFVVALQENDNADTFSVVSGGGNYQTDTTYDTLAFTVNALGTTQAAGSVQGGNQFQNGANGGNLIARVPGGAVSQQSAVSFWGTFYNYSADTGPRRIADISSGFTGTWDTEFLAFGVGNNGSGNDAASKTHEKMRLDASGGLRIGHTTNIFNSIEDERLTVKNTENGCAATFEATNITGGFPILYLRSTDSASSQYAIFFYRTNTAVGSITTSASSTAYNTSSDYRLKENVVSLDNAIDRVKQLSTYRFNFIADPDTTVDGFLAHEVSSIVPEAVTGEYNEVNDSGDPVYQGIDQSKLVPLLTKAIQELEARVAALESN